MISRTYRTHFLYFRPLSIDISDDLKALQLAF